MSAALLQQSSFRDLAERRVEVSGELRLEDCPRVGPVLRHGPGEFIRAGIALHLSDEREIIATGQVDARVYTPCGRCLEPVGLDVERSFQVQVVRVANEPASGELTSADGDFFIAPDGTGRLADIVEDEILLAMPDYPAHENGEACGALRAVLDRYESTAEASGPNRPFAVLAKLRKDAGEPGDSE